MTVIRPIAKQSSERQRPKSGWLAIAGLLLLGTLPVIGGVLRLGEVSSGSEIALPWTSVVAIVGHIVAMTVFCLVGAFQFSPALRIRRGWHRAAGRVLIPAGFVAALASIWLAVFFGGPPAELALAWVRLVFAVLMIVFLALAVIGVRRRDFGAHGIPMGEVDAVGETWLVAVGFVINSVVAELLIGRRSGR